MSVTKLETIIKILKENRIPGELSSNILKYISLNEITETNNDIKLCMTYFKKIDLLGIALEYSNMLIRCDMNRCKNIIENIETKILIKPEKKTG